MGSSSSAGATAGGVDAGRPGANMIKTSVKVVPALLLLLLVEQPSEAQKENGGKVKFGARVEQAKSKCSKGVAKCQFGFTFKEEESGRERNVIFVPPREEQDDDEKEERRENSRRAPVPQSSRRPPTPRQKLPPPDSTYFEIGHEVAKTLKFDPRKRQQKDRASKPRSPPTARTARPRPAAAFKTTTLPSTVVDQPVTITIGGVSLVIPDFGLKSANPGQPSNPSRRPIGARSRRPRPRITPSRFSTKRPVPSRASRRPVITPVQRTTTPSTFTSTLSSFEELASTLGDLSNSAAGRGRGFGRGFVQSRVVTSTTRAPVIRSSSTTVRAVKIARVRGRTRARQRGNSERTRKPEVQEETQSSVENLVEPELRECPGNLEGCVTACVPLDDVYVYSACVVECGKRCATED